MRQLSLSQEEAIALLEICLHTKADDDLLKVQVMEKVGELCREFIKGERQERASAPLPNDRAAAWDVVEAFRQRRSVPENACA